MRSLEKSKKYDQAVVEKYKKFVGEEELKSLNSVFTSQKFNGKWNQVLCSGTTRFLGTGPKYSSVQATYDSTVNGVISVKNDAYDNDFLKVSITGTSRARVETIPTCRTVKFNNSVNIEGDYWLIYATPSFNTIIVAAPIIIKIFNRPVVIKKNFGFYVLTRDITKFWSTKEEYEPTFTMLNKYRFDKFWNKPIATSETYKI